MEKELFEALSPYLDGLRTIGIPPPLILMMTLQSVAGVIYAVGLDRYGDFRAVQRLPRDILRLPECLLEDYGSDMEYHRAVRPAFDALWNSIGYVRSQWFNEDGLWVGPQR